jgi:hypothetical protein
MLDMKSQVAALHKVEKFAQTGRIAKNALKKARTEALLGELGVTSVDDQAPA